MGSCWPHICVFRLVGAGKPYNVGFRRTLPSTFWRNHAAAAMVGVCQEYALCLNGGMGSRFAVWWRRIERRP